jgi:SAM-dependent methyltransferase
MVSFQDVRAAYRLILGREPENEKIVAVLAERFSSLDELRHSFLSSEEYRTSAIIPQTLKPLSWEKISIATEASPEQLAMMVQHIEATWRSLGESKPYWSVLADEKFRSDNIEKNQADFYEGGKAFKLILTRTAERCGIDLDRYESCFELGCGVGRLTVWISQMFEKVIAADISQSHLKIARQALKNFDRSNVQLIHLNSFARIHTLPEFDVFISVIVLQHNPPPVIAMLLRSILERLRPGGIAFFQVPTYWKGYHFSNEEYIRDMTSDGTMEMHVISQSELFDILIRSRCHLLELREDEWTGSNLMVSNSLLVRKSFSY